MNHVAALAQSGEVAGPIVAGIMVQMRTSEHDASHARVWRGHAGKHELGTREIGPKLYGANPPSPPVTPSLDILVPPRSFTKVDHLAAVGPLAVLAPAFCSAKADQLG